MRSVFFSQIIGQLPQGIIKSIILRAVTGNYCKGSIFHILYFRLRQRAAIF